jgi:hypothetical protein
MLQNHAITRIPQGYLFQQDGAPPHYASESVSQSAVSRQMDWEKGSYRMASQVNRYDPFRFLSMGVYKRLGVLNKGARCGQTACRITAACEAVTPVILQNTW